MRPDASVARSLRVAYVCTDPGIPVFGSKGASIHVQEVLRTLIREGHRPILFTPRTGGEPVGRLEGLPVVTLPPVPGDSPADREARARLHDVHLPAALERAGPFDLVYQRYALWSDGGMRYAADRRIPGVLEVNAPLVAEQALHRTLVDREGAEAMTASAFGTASVLVAVSAGVAEWIRSLTPHPERVHVVPNGVDPSRFPPRSPDPDPDPRAPFTIGFVGTLKAWHGVPLLLEALERLLRRDPEGYRLLVVGDGPQRSTLEERVLERRLSRYVTFAGAVPPHQVPSLLASMDVAVAPYPEPGVEGFYFSPLKIFEYLAAGVPTVASRLGQIEEVVTHGVHGLLVPPGDVGALAEAIQRLRSDAFLRRILSREGRRRILEEHGWDRVVARILSLAFPAPGLVPAGAGE